MFDNVFTNVYTVREGKIKEPDCYAVILENVVDGHKIIFSPKDALWVGKQLIAQAKKTKKRNK